MNKSKATRSNVPPELSSEPNSVDLKTLQLTYDALKDRPQTAGKWIASLRNPSGWLGSAGAGLLAGGFYLANRGRFQRLKDIRKKRQEEEAAKALQAEQQAVEKQRAIDQANADAAKKLAERAAVASPVKQGFDRSNMMDYVNVLTLLNSTAHVKAANVNDFTRPIAEQMNYREKKAAELALDVFSQQHPNFAAVKAAVMQGYKLSSAVKQAFDAQNNPRLVADMVGRVAVKAASLAKQASEIEKIAAAFSKVDRKTDVLRRDLRIKKEAAVKKPKFLKSSTFKFAFAKSAALVARSNEIKRQLFAKMANDFGLSPVEFAVLLKAAGYTVDNNTVGQTISPKAKTFKRVMRNPAQVGSTQTPIQKKAGDPPAITEIPPESAPKAQSSPESPKVPASSGLASLNLGVSDNEALRQSAQTLDFLQRINPKQNIAANFKKLQEAGRLGGLATAEHNIAGALGELASAAKNRLISGVKEQQDSGGINPTQAALLGLGSLGIGAGGVALMNSGGKRRRDDDDEEKSASEKQAFMGRAVGSIKNLLGSAGSWVDDSNSAASEVTKRLATGAVGGGLGAQTGSDSASVMRNSALGALAGAGFSPVILKQLAKLKNLKPVTSDAA